MIASAAGERRAYRVCILTPGQLGSNPRVVKEAQALHDAGHAVTVIATRLLDIVEPRDQAVLRQAPWVSRRIDLRGRFVWKARRVVQMVCRRLHGITELAGLSPWAHSAVTPLLVQAALAVPADLYIAHYPAALPAAAAAARRHDAAFAYDAEDFHLGDWPDEPAYAGARTLVRQIERRHLPDCAYVTAASPGIADAYAAAYDVPRPDIMLNAFPRQQAPTGPTARGSIEPGPSVYWFSQVIGPNRGLDIAMHAVAAAHSRPHLHLRGTPDTGFVTTLTDLARSLGADDRLHILPPEAPDAMERIASGFDVGLCGEPGHTRNNALALSNKLFSYLLAGVPPVLSATPAHAAFAAEAGLAAHVFPIGDHAALATILDDLFADPARLAAARADAWRLGHQTYTWEREAETLLRLVEKACNG